MTNIAPDQFLILLVDDRADDRLTIRRAFQKARVVNPIVEVASGEEAIAYLKGEGKFSNREEFPLPELILLDLKMTGLSGFDVLQWIRAEPGIHSICTIVLSGSNSVCDVNRAYELGANSFLVKPIESVEFMNLAAAVKGYWLWMNKAPETTRSVGKRELA